MCERTAESRRQSDGSLRQLLERSEQWIRAVERPESKVADASAARDPLRKETLERHVHAARRAPRSAHQFARVKLRLWRFSKERYEPCAEPTGREVARIKHVRECNTNV